ncbi:DEAD/DEAH box helicase [Halomonas sp. H33-56]|uniref:ATP-dependent RNA helicase RhlE n=2 Tax=unclassified Halomonas TaxID=2609666 RepID=A0AAU7KMU7_9GAMM|nr:DEAD/DEAH box helicase [Halomonas sp. YLB-10]MBR9772360.1 DEAD/DEAH box helicase [Gammaproteobacteria bacterium]MBS8269235.1 ATP-dependent RNA helicase RhlE [Halomonas litopenaei]RQW69868.1 DEAD/DEAH box helicase [Halomonas sp. YLB-10]
MSFSDLGLRAELLRAVTAQGYDTPTPIQRQAIPAVLKGGDLLASAQTGTGKTAGFTLPMLQRLADGPRPSKRQVRALVLTPTRELAAQVGESVRDYGQHLSLRHHVIFGGVGQQPQIDALRPGLDVLVATPGRLLDLHQQGHVDLSSVEILVLDEADRMLDMGFIHDIRRVLKLLPEKRQNLLFSATFSSEIQALADKLLDRPEMIEVARRNTTAETVDQAVYRVDRERKRELLSHLITSQRWFQVLVFTRTKHGANRLAEHLDKRDISAMAIHGNKSQSARTRALAAFKAGELQVLVATDIAARGLDIDELPHVVNFELPNVAEDYVHRIGRTGRAGNEGQAISLVCVDEHGLLKNIERMIKRDLEKRIEPGFEPDPNAKPEPIENGRNKRGGGQRRSQGGNNSSQRGNGRRGDGGGGGGNARNGNGEQPARRRRRRSGQGNRQGQA